MKTKEREVRYSRAGCHERGSEIKNAVDGGWGKGDRPTNQNGRKHRPANQKDGKDKQKSEIEVETGSQTDRWTVGGSW